MERTSSGRSAPARLAVAVALAFTLAVTAFGRPADAAGLSLPVQMGQRFLGSASPAKPVPIPLSTKFGTVRPLAIAGLGTATFPPIKDPLLGITIFTSSEVKALVLETVQNLGDDTVLAFKVNALEHPNTAEFKIGGNCIGADGVTTPVCVATVTFTPTSVGSKMDPINAQITITRGMDEVEVSLRNALSNSGVKGQLVNLIYPLVQDYVRDALTDGIEDALLRPFAVPVGVGVAGPFTDPAVFVKRQYKDFAGGTPSSTQVSTWVKKFEDGSSPASLIEALRAGANWDGKVGPVSRLYSAYFLRAPDISGITFWVNRSRNGTRLYAISSTFAASSEFQRRYGSLTNAEFVDLVYRNVLGRSPDSSGRAYWTRQLEKGQTRGRLMVGFSESSEYIRKQSATVKVIEIWFGMLKRMPTAAEQAAAAPRLAGGTPTVTIITELMASAEYRKVVLG